jgi:hypothetical protein
MKRFRQDGFLDLFKAHLPTFPYNCWIVSIHVAESGDFHLRRLDMDGWSEKCGDGEVSECDPLTSRDLLLAASESGTYTTFGGFFIASSAIAGS